MPDETNTLVGTRYRLDHPLGTGATGTVYSAEDTVLGRQVAVKVVELDRASLGDQDVVRGRVLREARAAARIDDPGSVRVFDVIEDGNRVYLVMELVSAPTLAELVAERGGLDEAAAARLGLDVLGALTMAHAAGIVHRDVKPSNVLVLAGGQAKLGDFGIASLVDDASLTSTGMVLGTPRFMAPEQALGERAGAPADIWALGALLQFAVEGEGPFDRDGHLPTLHAIVHEHPRPMRRRGRLSDAVRAMLARRPEDRPDDESVRLLLLEVLSNPAPDTTTLVAAPPTEVLVEQPPARPAPPPRSTAPTTTTTSTSRRRWPVLAATGLAVLGLAGVVLAGADDDTAGRAATGTSSSTAGASSSTAAPRSSTTRPATTAAPSGAGWTTYRANAGWSVPVPGGWVAEPAGGNRIDFQAPTGEYLRVDWTPTPGNDAVAAWESSERAFAAQHPDYRRIRIEPTDYRGWEAATWEFTFQGRHAVNLGFVPGARGYALNLVAPADRWAELQDEWARIRDGFQPA